MTLSFEALDPITVWDIGDDVPLRAVVRNADGDLADPTDGVLAWYMKPGGEMTEVELTNVSEGLYEAVLQPATGEDGDWWWKVKTSGDIRLAEERTFTVRPEVVT